MRVLIFTDVNGPVSATLAAATLRVAASRGDLEVCGVVTSQPEAFRSGALRRCLRTGRRMAVAGLNREVPLASVVSPTLDLPALEERSGVRLIVPEGGDPNDPRFIRRLASDLRPDVALSLYCLRLFRGRLLDQFEQSVNYHDSLLPAHRGVLATSFSVYAGDRSTGFTYHRMTTVIDGGPILAQGAVPVSASEPIWAIKARKLAAAVDALPGVLDMVVARAPGRPPVAGGEYHSRADARAMLHVARPRDIDSAELAQRLRAFGVVNLTIGGVEYPVTRVRESINGRRLAFATADGVVLEPDRLAGLTVGLYRLSTVGGTQYRTSARPAPNQ